MWVWRRHRWDPPSQWLRETTLACYDVQIPSFGPCAAHPCVSGHGEVDPAVSNGLCPALDLPRIGSTLS